MTIKARKPLSRKTTMDETIEEGLNFIRSGGATYYSEYFPLTLGKRTKVSRDSITRDPSPKRARKETKKIDDEDYEMDIDVSKKSKKAPAVNRGRKSKTKKKRNNGSAKKSARKSYAPVFTPTYVTPTETTPVYTIPASTQFCPASFNNGSFDFEDLNEYKSTRRMKDTGTDERITEIVFSFDTTGSMGAAIAEAKKNIVEITNRLFDTVTGLRIGIIAHGDYCDSSSSVFQVKELSDSKEEIINWIGKAVNGSGGDAPENYEQVLEYCAKDMNWTEGSNRVLVMIGDQVPHEPKDTKSQMESYNCPNPREIDWRDEIDNCWKNGIKIYGIQVNAVQDYVKYFYASLAARTCGAHVVLNNFPVVTDMLLMVCFREANRGAFDDFRSEVEREGRMDKERQQMFEVVKLRQTV